MKVSELGEFGLIGLLARMADEAIDNEKKAWKQLILGIGDDASAWQGSDSIQLATTDSLIQGVHFTLEITSWEELGWRALAANLSDIAAMGGVPQYALVSLALPGHTEVEDVTALYRGIIGLAKRFDVAVAGGDTSSAPLLVINITVLGDRSQGQPLLTRSAARPGDIVAVTGNLGAAAAGLEMLAKHLQFNPDATSSLKKAFLQPCPRVAEGQLLAEKGVRATIDISDGLIADLGHICEASQVGARIEIDKVPVHSAVEANFSDRALEFALSGGEDYELLFTAGTEVIDKVSSTASCPITTIGEITADNAGKVALIDSEGKPVSLPGTGWEHFTVR